MKQHAAAAVNPNTFKGAFWWLAEVREARNKPSAPEAVAIGKVQEIDSSLTRTAKRIKLNDCTNATTGDTNETEPIENAW